MRIILASGSPRRRELLDFINIPYEVIVSSADETLKDSISIEEQSKSLAYKKAESVFSKISGDKLVIGADTLVLKDGKVYGKPADLKDAKNMLQQLQGETHKVITSYAILVEKEGKVEQIIDYDLTEVKVSKMTLQEIEEYISNEEVLDKAGSYAIQSSFSKFIENINGNYTTVLGLPINKIYQAIKQYL